MTMKIALLLDASGSMAPDRQITLDAVNEYVSGLKAQKKTKKAEFFLATFNDSIGVKFLHEGVLVKDVPELTADLYHPMAMTPLYDAIGKTIALIDKGSTVNDKVLFIIFTDGQENLSKEFKSKDEISRLMDSMKRQGNWSFVFLGADINAFTARDSMGIRASDGNTMSFAKGDTMKVMLDTAAATQSYVASGARSTDEFYKKND
jgi:hypothetical protein